MSEVQFQVDYSFSPAPFSASDEVAIEDVQRAHVHLSLVSTLASLRSWRYLFVKRAIDIVLAVAMVAVMLIPGLIIAAAILLTSGGPVFYRETRVGRRGTPFLIWKFRSMRRNSAWFGWKDKDTPDGHGSVLKWRVHKKSVDPRVTAFGGFLRRWSLDEIPQLWNVLRGEMSLVGPRPVIEEEVAMYGYLENFYLAATPGLSGLWQVSGRSDIAFSRRAKLDAFYVQNWTLRQDFAILLRTVPAVLSKRGAR
jgi:lipopolysaccharide/colanic/teichoic acid biosynthesis glycosyltransferase